VANLSGTSFSAILNAFKDLIPIRNQLVAQASRLCTPRLNGLLPKSAYFNFQNHFYV
jgi:hypothetical protein